MAEAARSVHLNYTVPTHATAVQNSIIVQTSQKGSYFCAINFCTGYMGVQELYNGEKVVIFSVWDNKSNDDPTEKKKAQIIYHGQGVDIQRFGGEGTGLRCLKPYDWYLNEECTFRVDAEKEGHWTTYKGQYYDQRQKVWFHIATLRTLCDSLLNNCACFVEDFRRDGNSYNEKRKACFTNFKFLSNKEWEECRTARFTADSNPVTNINAGQQNNVLFLETGGSTENNGTTLNELVTLS